MKRRIFAALALSLSVGIPAVCLAQSADNGAIYTLEDDPVYTHTTTHPDPHTGHYQDQSQTQATLYPTARAAERHCPNDTVVWLNTRTGVYNDLYGGRTRVGGYVCTGEANAAGDREMHNGR